MNMDNSLKRLPLEDGRWMNSFTDSEILRGSAEFRVFSRIFGYLWDQCKKEQDAILQAMRFYFWRVYSFWMNIKLSIQPSFASGSRLMVIIHIHWIIYLLECRTRELWTQGPLKFRVWQLFLEGFIWSSCFGNWG